MSFEPVFESRLFLLQGLWVTIMLSLIVALISTVVGLAIGLARMYGSSWLAAVLGFYVDSLRSLPELAVLVLVFFSIPVLTGMSISPFWAAVLAFSVQMSAYMSEIVRAGVGSIRRGQRQAGLALGMSEAQIVRKIILPQAAVRVLPAYGSQLSVIIKTSAIAIVIAAPEFMNSSQTVAAQSFQPIGVFTVAMVVYFCILYPVTRGAERLYQRYVHLGQS